MDGRMGHFAGELYDVKYARVMRDHGLGHFERGNTHFLRSVVQLEPEEFSEGIGGNALFSQN